MAGLKGNALRVGGTLFTDCKRFLILRKVNFKKIHIRYSKNQSPGGCAAGDLLARAKPVSAFTILLLLISFASVAQPYISRLGRFQVDQVKGCAPLTVTITNANLSTVGECTGTKPCLMNYEALGQLQNTFTYVYTTPGTFKLSVLYQSQVTGPDDITITVLPNIQPNFEIYTCSSNGVSVKVTDKNYDQYFIDFGVASPVIGYLTLTRGVTVHVTDCANVKTADAQRLLDARWA